MTKPECTHALGAYYDGQPESCVHGHSEQECVDQECPARGRRWSGEADYGVHWTLPGDTARWRVSYVRDTQEVYATRKDDRQGTTLVLGTFPADQDAGPMDIYYHGLEQHLDGWALRCTIPGQLVWVRDRMELPQDPTETTHLLASRNPDGRETALCGARTGLIFFIRHLEDRTSRKITCPDCCAIQNQPPDRVEYREPNPIFSNPQDTNPREDHACRACGLPISPGTHGPGNTMQEIRGASTTCVCPNCQSQDRQNLRMPQPYGGTE